MPGMARHDISLRSRTKIKPLLNAEINEETGSNKQRNRSASIDANIISNAEKAWTGYMLDGDENNGRGFMVTRLG